MNRKLKFILFTFIFILIFILLSLLSNGILSLFLNFNSKVDYFTRFIETYKKYWIYISGFSFFVILILILGIIFNKLKIKKDKIFKKDLSNNSDNSGFLVDEINKINTRNLKRFLVKKNQKADNGFVIKYDKNNWYVVNQGQPHAIVVGATESGKTQKVILPNIYYNSSTFLNERQANFILTIPKNEISKIMGNTLKDRGYKIYNLDIEDTKFSLGWNPLSYIWDIFHQKAADKIQKYELEAEAFKELRDIIYALPWNNDNSSSIWVQGAKDRVLAICKFLLYYSLFDLEYKKEYFNLAEITKFLDLEFFEKGWWIQEMKNNLDNENMKKAWESVSKFLGIHTEGQSSFLMNAQTTLSIFHDDLKIKSFISRDDFKIDQIFEDNTKPFAVFINYADNKPANFFLMSILIQQIYQKAVSKADKEVNGKLKRALYFGLDEFGNMPKINNFSNMLTISRSRDIHILAGIQSEEQINFIYNKDDSKTIIDNFTLLYFISSNNQKTLEEVSKKIGDKQVIKKSFSKSNSRESEKSTSENESVAEEKIMPISKLANLEKNQIIIKPLQIKPLFLYSTPAYEIFGKYEPFNYKTEDNIKPFIEENYSFNKQIKFVPKKSKSELLDAIKSSREARKKEENLEEIEKPKIQEKQLSNCPKCNEKLDKYILNNEILYKCPNNNPIDLICDYEAREKNE